MKACADPYFASCTRIQNLTLSTNNFIIIMNMGNDDEKRKAYFLATKLCYVHRYDSLRGTRSRRFAMVYATSHQNIRKIYNKIIILVGIQIEICKMSTSINCTYLYMYFINVSFVIYDIIVV